MTELESENASRTRSRVSRGSDGALGASSGSAVFRYLIHVAKLVLLTVLVVLASFNVLVPFASLLFVERGLSSPQADESLERAFTKEELAILSPFVLLSSKSNEYTSTTNRVFLDSLGEFVRSIEAQGISLPDALNPRFFSPKNSGVLMLRQVHEIPAQVIRSMPE